MSLRILWINERADSAGGCEQYVRETALRLREYDVRSDLLYSVESRPERNFLSSFDRAFPFVNLSEQIAAIVPDVVYVHRLSDIRLIAALTRANVPVLRFFHDHKPFCPREHKYTLIGKHTCTRRVSLGCVACLGFINRTERGFALRTLGSVEQELEINRHLSGFVVASAYMRDHLILHQFPAEKIHVLPLYASPPDRSQETPREKDLLVFAGQLITGKGIDTLLHALAQTKTKPRLEICGVGKFENEYRAITARLQLENRVTFVGKRTPLQLETSYRRAAAVVVPSRAPETFGLVGPEAMRFGTPVIATTVGGMGEWLLPEVTGLGVRPNDAPGLAEAIDRLMSDETLREKLGHAAAERYASNFRPEIHLKSLINVFLAATQGRR